MAKIDLSEFRSLATRGRKPTCKVGLVVGDLNGEAATLQAACDAEDITVGGICKWLEKRGHEVSPSAVTSHRNGKCTCADR